MRQLTILSGLAKGTVCPLSLDQVEIGRADENTLVLDDNDVSRRHAVLTRDGEEYKVQDLGTLNGTWVNQQQVKEARLRAGDIVQFGLVETRYEPLVATAAEPPAAAAGSLVARVEELSRRNEELTARLTQKDEEISRFQQKADQRLEQELKAVNDQLTRARGEVERVKEQAEERLRLELTERRRIENELNRAQAERQRVAHELAETRNRLQEVSHQLEEARKGGVSLGERQAIEREVQILRRRAAADHEQLVAQHQQELGRLRGALTEARAEIELHAKKETAKITVVPRVAADGESGGELQRVRSELEKARSELTVARQQAGRVEELVQENQELAKKLADTQRHIAELRARQPARAEQGESPATVREEKSPGPTAEPRRGPVSSSAMRQPAPAAATITQAAMGPLPSDETSPFEHGPPPGRRQKLVAGLVVAAILGGLLWQLFRGDSESDAFPSRQPLVDNRLILEENPRSTLVPEPLEVESPAPLFVADAEPAGRPADESTAAAASFNPAEKPATVYLDDFGRFSCSPPKNWEVISESTPLQSRVRFVSGEDEIVVFVHGRDWPPLELKDQQALTNSMITQFRLRYPSAFAELQAAEWQMMGDGGLGLQIDLAVNDNGKVSWVRLLEYRAHGRSATLELVVRQVAQRDLLAIIFDAFLAQLEILPTGSSSAP